jgi:AcrR family transcriptional regulator
VPETTRPYHHGALRSELIESAVAEVEAVGAAGVSMREIARRAGVSHAAPLHHFGDKAGLFTAIATEGFRMQAEAIGATVDGPFGFLDGGVTYVLWALEHPGHFEVMFRPGLFRTDDPGLVAAREAAFDVLLESASALAAEWEVDDVTGLAMTGWSLSHGLATLLIAGNFDSERLPTTPDAIAEHIANGLVGLGRVTAIRRTKDAGTG